MLVSQVHSKANDDIASEAAINTLPRANLQARLEMVGHRLASDSFFALGALEAGGELVVGLPVHLEIHDVFKASRNRAQRAPQHRDDGFSVRLLSQPSQLPLEIDMDVHRFAFEGSGFHEVVEHCVRKDVFFGSAAVEAVTAEETIASMIRLDVADERLPVGRLECAISAAGPTSVGALVRFQMFCKITLAGC